jgi:STI1 domain
MKQTVSGDGTLFLMSIKSAPFLLLLLIWSLEAAAFAPTTRGSGPKSRCVASLSLCQQSRGTAATITIVRSNRPRSRTTVVRSMDDSVSGDMDNDEESVEPGAMRISEIKAELDLRGISYADCFDKESLVQKLLDARAAGRADPSILRKFNQQRFEQQFSKDSSAEESQSAIRNEDVIQAAVANDGSLPGGLSPEMFQKLASNPEIMVLLQNSKVQEAMQLIMTSGPSELERQLQEDPELRETVGKLQDLLKSLQ